MYLSTSCSGCHIERQIRFPGLWQPFLKPPCSGQPALRKRELDLALHQPRRRGVLHAVFNGTRTCNNWKKKIRWKHRKSLKILIMKDVTAQNDLIMREFTHREKYNKRCETTFWIWCFPLVDLGLLCCLQVVYKVEDRHKPELLCGIAHPELYLELVSQGIESSFRLIFGFYEIRIGIRQRTSKTHTLLHIVHVNEN